MKVEPYSQHGLPKRKSKYKINTTKVLIVYTSVILACIRVKRRFGGLICSTRCRNNWTMSRKNFFIEDSLILASSGGTGTRPLGWI